MQHIKAYKTPRSI